MAWRRGRGVWEIACCCRSATCQGLEPLVAGRGRYPTHAKIIYSQVAAVLEKGGFKKVAYGVYAVAKRPSRMPGKKAETPVDEEK